MSNRNTAIAFVHDRALNVARGCRLRGCMEPRKGLSAWCRLHLEQSNRLGHPSARPLRASTWATERKEVGAVFAAHPDHPGLMQVLDYLKTWMATASGNESAYKGAREMARLARHGVTGPQVLTEVAAFHLWEGANPMAFPDDRARDFARARAVFGLAPRTRRAVMRPGSISGTYGLPTTGPKSYSVRPMPSGLAFVGKHLREAFSPLLAQVQHAVERRRVLKVDPEANLRLPFRHALTFT